MPEHTTLVGYVLLAVVPLIVWDAVGSLRAGFDSAFWALSLEEKLPRIAERSAAWRRLGTIWVFVIALLASGFTAFAAQLGMAGEPELAALGLGAFVTGAVAFLFVVLPMVMAVDQVAQTRDDGDEVPGWARAVWDSSWRFERFFVVTANLAYVVWGLAIIDSGFPASWVGWVAGGSGLLIAGWASVRDYFFQHMTLITPIVVGIALILT